MRIDAIAIGSNPPNDVNVIIEVPVGGVYAHDDTLVHGSRMTVDSGRGCALSTGGIGPRLAGAGTALILAGTWLLATPPLRVQAAAHTSRSLYTSVDLDHCTVLRSDPDGKAWQCEGLPGFPLYVATGDNRTFLSVGERPQERRAAQQTLGAFNTPFESRSGRMTVEWRFVRRQGRALPYAIIVRYFTASDSGKGEVLVVSRIGEADACHVAYIDALATKDAIVLARQLADEKARDFNCAGEPGIEGKRGVSPM